MEPKDPQMKLCPDCGMMLDNDNSLMDEEYRKDGSCESCYDPTPYQYDSSRATSNFVDNRFRRPRD